SHVYNIPGTFTTTLKITDSFGCTDSISNENDIIITDPNAGFTTDDTNTCIGKPVTITNTSTGTGLTNTWYFSDGKISDDETATVTFDTDGTYDVKLVITDVNGCKDSTEIKDYIETSTAKALFT